MAHCIWLSDEEIYTLRERGVGVAHCPNSNISVRSGLCDVRRLINHGLKVGLGTGMLVTQTSNLLTIYKLPVHLIY